MSQVPPSVFSPALDDPWLQIVSMLTPKERLKFSLACQNTLRLVEYHSETMLTNLIRDMEPDNTFMDRIREISNRGFFTCSQPDPGQLLPYRYLLHAAKKSYLYKDDFPHTIYAEALDPATKCVFFASSEETTNGLYQTVILKWDLQHRRLLLSLKIPAHILPFYETQANRPHSPGHPKGVFMCKEQIVLFSQGALIIYSMNGDNGPSFWRGYDGVENDHRLIDVEQESDTELVFLARDRSDREVTLWRFNVVTGVRTKVESAGLKINTDSSLKGIFAKRWCLMQCPAEFTIRDYRNGNNLVDTKVGNYYPYPRYLLPETNFICRIVPRTTWLEVKVEITTIDEATGALVDRSIDCWPVLPDPGPDHCYRNGAFKFSARGICGSYIFLGRTTSFLYKNDIVFHLDIETGNIDSSWTIPRNYKISEGWDYNESPPAFFSFQDSNVCTAKIDPKANNQASQTSSFLATFIKPGLY